MGAPSVSAGPVATAPTPPRATDPVAGRIDASPSPLQDAISAWLAHLAAKGRKPNTILAFRQFIEKATRERGWSDVRDLTFAAIDGYLAEHAANWKGVTYKRNLVVFRSFTRYLLAAQLLNQDPLALATSPAHDGGAGSRASTTDEARRFIELADARARFDRRASPWAGAYFKCLWLAGCRYEEPARWRWKHLKLDEPIPFIVWEPEISKNHKRQVVVMAPELVEVLRAHRDRVALEHGTGPEDLIFPEQPSRVTMRTYRDELGIPAIDAQGRPWSAHSARKWFATTLAQAGVHERMVDCLMRHTSSVQSRYFDPSLADQLSALKVLPRLTGEVQWSQKKNESTLTHDGASDSDSSPDPIQEMGVDGISPRGHTHGVVSSPTAQPTTDLHSTPRGAPESERQGLRHSADAGASRDDRVKMKAVSKGRSGTRDGSVTSDIRLEVPSVGSITLTESAAAVLLRALADHLDRGGENERRSQGQKHHAG